MQYEAGGQSILVIDDDPMILSSLAAYLEDCDYTVHLAENGRAGLEKIHKSSPDLVLIDLQMPEMDGLTVIRQLSKETPELPIIVVSGTGVITEAVEALRSGAWDFVTKPIHDFGILEHSITRCFNSARLYKENQAYKNQLEQRVQERTQELQAKTTALRATLNATVNTLSLLTDTRDAYTGTHQRRVTAIVALMAKQMELPKQQQETLSVAAMLHDIGQLAIPPEFLTKPGALSDIEWEFVYEHPATGYTILKDIPFPGPVAEIILQHHERLDGSGYPKGLSGDKIMLEARIIAVADVAEAMLSHRPHRPAFSQNEVFDFISKNKNTLFCPTCADALLKVLTTPDSFAHIFSG